MTETRERSEDLVEVGIYFLPHHQGLPSPSRMTSGSSGYDVFAACDDDIVIEPGSVSLVPSGFKMAVPGGYEVQVRPRSGLAIRERIGILNSPGTIDSDYRGEVSIILYNFGSGPFTVRRGDRIAQLVVCKLPCVKMVELEKIDETGRGEGGFGHTG